MTALLLAAAAFAWAAGEVPADAPARRAYCAKNVTAEKMLLRSLGPYSREGLFDYATCTELVEGRKDLCPLMPGAPGRAGGAGPAPSFTVTKGDGKTGLDFEYGVCVSRSAGYLFLAGVAKDAPREKLLEHARGMLHGEKALTPEELTDASLLVRKTGKTDDPRLPAAARRGFLNYLAGKKACASVKAARLKGECLRKAAALEALAAGDAALCAKDDLMCRALIEGREACEARGRQAVDAFCREVFPTLTLAEADWKLLRRPAAELRQIPEGGQIDIMPASTP